MALSLLPVSAFAAELEDSGAPALQAALQEDTAPSNEIATQSSNDVAQVLAADGKLIGNYTSFANAHNDAKDIPNCTLKLLKDVTISYSYTISNFTLDGTGHTISAKSFLNSLSLENSAEITGGTFNATVTLKSGAKLSGGSYTTLQKRIASWKDALAPGYGFYKNGNELSETDLSEITGFLQDVEVKPSSGPTGTIDAAQIGDTKYETLSAAIKNAKARDTVKLLSSVTEDVTIDKAIILDLSSYGITGTVTITDAGARLTTTSTFNNSGTITNLKITAADKTLLDVLETGFAYQKSDRTTNGAVSQLEYVQIATHYSCYFGNSTTCACGRVKDTTRPVITLDSSTIYYDGTAESTPYVEVKGNKLYFTVTDDTAVASVFNGETPLTPDSDGKYSIEIDNEDKDVNDNLKEGYQPVRIIAEDTAGNKTDEWYFIAYRMVETKITQVPDGIKILSICDDKVTTDKPADYSRWRRAASPYWVKFQVENQPWFKAEEYLKLRLFYIERPAYTAKSELSCKKTSDGNYLFTTVAGNEGEAAWHLATYLKGNRVDKENGEKSFLTSS